ncbi:hypothetical protein [Caproiciproducens sp.]
MWHYWQDIVIRDSKNGIPFGICKHEKPSKRGCDANGNILNQTSYQILNSMPITANEMLELCSFELDYINKLKTDNGFFLEYIKQSATDRNCNQMVYDLAKHTPEFMNTDEFYNFKDRNICNFVSHCKHGKIRLNSDYCVMLGNGIEYLYHAVGDERIKEENPERLSLIDNQIYTPLFKDGDELSCFRSPHTSPSNCYLGINTKNELIDKYFNLSENIVYVNSIGFPIQDMLSSCDYDSDQILVVKNSTLLANVKKVFKQYRVCINEVPKSNKTYDATLKNMAAIDNDLADSQKEIGKTVNSGQLVMSAFWNKLNTEGIVDNELMKKADIATVLSCIVIDSAKKVYKINKKQAIKDLLNCSDGTFPKIEATYQRKTNNGVKEYKRMINSKPNFFKYISQSNNIGKYMNHYETAMDYLYDIFTNCKKESYDNRNKILFVKLLNTKEIDGSNMDRDKRKKVIDYVANMDSELSKCKAIKISEFDEQLKKKNEIRENNIIQYYRYYLRKNKIDDKMMYAIMIYILKNNISSIMLRLLNELYINNSNAFLDIFKKSAT